MGEAMRHPTVAEATLLAVTARYLEVEADPQAVTALHQQVEEFATYASVPVPTSIGSVSTQAPTSVGTPSSSSASPSTRTEDARASSSSTTAKGPSTTGE